MGVDMSVFAIVRADQLSKVKIALNDLVQHGNLSFGNSPRQISPTYADEILVNVMNRPLKNRCNAAAMVSLTNHPKDAINSLKEIHPPAHIVIVSPMHGIHSELVEHMNMLSLIHISEPT